MILHVYSILEISIFHTFWNSTRSDRNSFRVLTGSAPVSSEDGPAEHFVRRPEPRRGGRALPEARQRGGEAMKKRRIFIYIHRQIIRRQKPFLRYLPSYFRLRWWELELVQTHVFSTTKLQHLICFAKEARDDMPRQWSCKPPSHLVKQRHFNRMISGCFGQKLWQQNIWENEWCFLPVCSTWLQLLPVI